VRGDFGAVNPEEEFRAMYAEMSHDEILQLAAEGGLRPEAEVVFSEQVRLRKISAADVDAERERLRRAKLQATVGRNPYWGREGLGLRFRGRSFRSAEDEMHRISVRTRWVVFCWMSIVPLGSYRVKEAVGDKKKFEIVSKEPLEWGQVFEGWMLAGAVVLVLVCLSMWGR
jgi:hypothetical protein